jgi:hypothetical protein
MTALYDSTTNSLTEQPQKEKPEMWDEYVFAVKNNAFKINVTKKEKEDIDNFKAHIASLRTIPCDESCRGVFIHGCEYEEGRDYERVGKHMGTPPEGMYAIPLSPPVQEDDLNKIYDGIKEQCKNSLSGLTIGRGLTTKDWNRIYEDAAYEFIEHLKQHFTITKKTRP